MEHAKTTSDYRLAKDILGNDFISPEDVQKHRDGIIYNGMVYTHDQLKVLKETLPSKQVLESCRDNEYMLIPGPNRPMSLLEVRSFEKGHFFSPEMGDWYIDEAFAQNDRVETRWIMLRKRELPESTSKNWNDQQALLSEDEVVPNAAEVAWCVIIYQAVRDTYLLRNICVRVSSLVSDGNRVHVGPFDSGGLVISYYGDVRRGNLGVSAARKERL